MNKTKGNRIRVTLSIEEILACLIALEKERKPYHWQRQAIRKLEKSGGFRESSHRQEVGG